MSIAGNSKLSERLANLALIVPVTITTTASSATSAYVDMLAVTQTSTTGATTNKSGGYFHRYLATFITGDNGTGSVTFNVLKASDTSGTGSAVVYSAAYAATNGDNIIAPFDINGDNVDTSKPYIAIQATIDSGTCPVAGLLQGGDARYEPAQTYSTATTKAPGGA